MPKKEKIVPLLEEKYYSDMRRDGMLYAVEIRSPFSGGRFISLSLEGLNEEEGEFFFSAKDIPGINEVEISGEIFPLMAQNEAHYKGEIVGIAVAKSEKRAKEMAKRVLISPDKAEISFFLKSALKNTFLPKKESASFKTADAALLGFPFRAKNEDVIYEKYFVKTPEVFKAERENDKSSEEDDSPKKDEEGASEVFESHFSFEDDFYECGEKFGVFAVPTGEHVFIYAGVSWPENVRLNAAKILALPKKNVIIKETRRDIHSFPSPEEETKLAALASLAARKSGFPVRLVSDKFYHSKLAASFSLKTEINREGEIQKMECECVFDAGYRTPFYRELAYASLFPFFSLYGGEIKFRVRIISTKKYPSYSVSESAAQLSAVALEAHLNEIAWKTGIYPDLIRRKNLLKKNSLLKNALEKLLEKSDFSRKYSASRSMKRKDNSFSSLPSRGFALSFALSQNFYPSALPKYKVKLKAALTSDSLIVSSPFIEGRERNEWEAMMREEMKNEETGEIKIECSENSASFFTVPTSLYRNFTLLYVLLKRALADIKSRHFKEPLPITSEKSASLYFPTDDEKSTGKSFVSFAKGCAAMESVLDLSKFRIKIASLYIVIDAGRIYDLQMAENEAKLLIEKELCCLIEGLSVKCDFISVEFLESKEKPSSFASIIPPLVRSAFLSSINEAASKRTGKLAAKITEVLS